jgi:hypothetical protein
MVIAILKYSIHKLKNRQYIVVLGKFQSLQTNVVYAANKREQ